MKRRPARAKIFAVLIKALMARKFVELLLQVADKQRRLAERGYDGRVVRVEG